MLFMFDMGGVVTTNFDMDKVYQKLSMSQNAFLDLCKTDSRDLWKDLETGNIEVKEFWKMFNKRASEIKGPEVTTDLFRLYFHPQLNKETVEIIKALKKNHRVICATNTMQSHWENHLERGDYALFDQTYASNKIGIMKPSSDFFTTILEAENCDPSQAFFTDDKLENIIAAGRVGINAIQFTDAFSLKAAWQKYF